MLTLQYSHWIRVRIDAIQLTGADQTLGNAYVCCTSSVQQNNQLRPPEGIGRVALADHRAAELPPSILST